MDLIVKLNFSFDEMDDCSEEEIKNYLLTALESGAESTSCEIRVSTVEFVK